MGVDIASFWEPLTGVGWYLFRLLENLADNEEIRLRLYGPSIVESTDLPDPVVALPTGPTLERVSLPVPDDLLLPPGLMSKLLRKADYQTAVVGKWHLGTHMAPQGYDYSEVLIGQGPYYNPPMLKNGGYRPDARFHWSN